MSGLGFCPDRLNAMLQLIGQAVTWERASRCPCRSTRTGGPEVSCPVCRGVGWIWDTPVPCMLGVSGSTPSRKFAAFTEWEDGDVLVTIPSDSPAYDMGERDRITLTDASHRMSEVLTRGVNDQLRYRKPLVIHSVWAIVSNERKDYHDLIDYKVDGHTVTWLTAGPAQNQQYAVLYNAQPEYFVYRELVGDRPMGGRSMPRKVHVKLMELFNRAVP